MTPLLFGILMAMFIAITVVKIAMLWQKKENISGLKEAMKKGDLKDMAKRFVDKLKYDKAFEQTMTMMIFADIFMFALNWVIGISMFIFTLLILLLRLYR